MPEYLDGPAFYATGRRSRWRDVRAVLHPPYTMWHLSYVVLGAVVATKVNWTTLAATLLAFFLAVGVCAHCLDELHGRPLATELSTRVLVIAAVMSFTSALALGVIGATRVGPGLVIFVVVGAALVLAYNLEWLGGLIHNDLGFALAWGAFPVLTSAFAQERRISVAAVVLALAAALLSGAQRSLSTPVRLVRRRVTSVHGEMTFDDGSVRSIDRASLLVPSERALRTLSWAVMAMALGLALVRARL